MSDTMDLQDPPIGTYNTDALAGVKDDLIAALFERNALAGKLAGIAQIAREQRASFHLWNYPSPVSLQDALKRLHEEIER